MSNRESKTIHVKYLARVEGEGELYLSLKDKELEDVRLKIFEPPRFFEALLRGRNYTEAPDITSRICGICPVAYQMSVCQAMEQGFGVRPEAAIQDLRRLLYCGEWISSHTLHIYMLHAPDFLGYESAIHMAKDLPKVVERGLQLKKAGTDIMSLIGGREIHPINIRVGGFYKVPYKSEISALDERLKWACEAALETIQWVGKFQFPALERDYEFVALKNAEQYPILEGRLASSKGLDIEHSQFDEYFEEVQVPYSNALQATIKGRGAYLTGPMARYALNYHNLSPLAKQAATEAGLQPVCNNPFQSIIVRSVEVLYACEEALRIIRAYEPPSRPAIPIELRAMTGHGCTEAPRGILYHQYSVNESGEILNARIVPPTSQNQKTIEEDLWNFVPQYLELPEQKLQCQCERLIRNHDPCISCSVHFLKLKIDHH